MESEISEDMQIAMLLDCFGDTKKSPYDHFVTSLQTINDSLSWETVTALLLQEFEEQSSRTGNPKIAKMVEESQAITANVVLTSAFICENSAAGLRGAGVATVTRFVTRRAIADKSLSNRMLDLSTVMLFITTTR